MAIEFFAKRLDFFWYLNQQAETLVRASGLLKEASLAGVLDEDLARRINRLESEGDAFFHELTDRLNRTFITPLDREDIHALGDSLDDVLDLVNAMAGRLLLYRLDPADAHFARLAGAGEAFLGAGRLKRGAYDHNYEKAAEYSVSHCPAGGRQRAVRRCCQRHSGAA